MAEPMRMREATGPREVPLTIESGELERGTSTTPIGCNEVGEELGGNEVVEDPGGNNDGEDGNGAGGIVRDETEVEEVIESGVGTTTGE